MSSGDIVSTRAAASSTASGTPSSRPQISRTAAAASSSSANSGSDAPGAFAEQRDRVGGRIEGTHRHDLLALEVERFPAGRHHHHARAPVDDRGGEVGGGVEHVLAVVEHEDAPGGAEVVAHDVDVGSTRPLARTERADHHRPDRIGIAGAGQLGQPCAAGEPWQRVDRGLQRQAGLADATDTGQGQEPSGIA